MSSFERFAQALALTETGTEPLRFGDAGRACGTWQMHPEFFYDYYPGRPIPGDTWEAWMKRALLEFWVSKHDEYPDPGTLASIFHLGLAAFKRGDTDEDYDRRFTLNWARLAGLEPKTEVS